MDVAASLSSPSGLKLVEADSPVGEQGPELLAVVSEESGTYILDVRAIWPPDTTGQYLIAVEGPRRSGEQEEKRVAAARLLQEGHRQDGPSPAGEKYEAALALFREAQDRYGAGMALEYLGNRYANQFAAEKGIAYLNESLSIWRELNDRRRECSVLKDLGEAYAGIGDEDKGGEHFDRAISLARSLGDRTLEANLLFNSGTLILDQRQKALDNLLLALSIFREIGDKASEAFTLNSIGNFYFDVGEYQDAIGYFTQTSAVWRDVGDRRMEAFTLRNIGQAYKYAGQYAQALDYTGRALSIFRTDVPNQHAATLERIGEIYKLMGDFRKALECFDQAVSIRKTLGRSSANPHAFPRLLLAAARTYKESGEREKALEHIEQAVELIPDIPYPNHRAMRWRDAAVLYNSLGEREKAVKLLMQALETDREIARKSDEAETLAALARVELDAGRLPEARARGEEAVGMVEAFRLRFDDDQLRASYGATVQRFYDLVIEILMRQHGTNPAGGYDAAAFEMSERKRARGLLELLAEGRVDIRLGVDPALVEGERRLERRLDASAERQSELLAGRHSAEQAAAVSAEISLLTSEYRRARAEIRRTSPHYAGLTQPSALSLEEVQSQLLDADSVLLEYALGDERSFLWVVTRGSITSYELPKRSEVEAQARRVYKLLTARNLRPPGETVAMRQARVAQADRDFEEAASRLSRMALGPALPVIGTKRLLVVADGALQYVPFAALPKPTAGGGDGTLPLIAENEVVNLPSASVLAVLRREAGARKPAAKSVAVLADPVFDDRDPRVKSAGVSFVAAAAKQKASPKAPPSELERSLRDFGLRDERGALSRLPFSREEAEAIIGAAPVGSGLRALDFSASREAAMSAELSQYRVVHFATHGLLNTEQPALSGLVFSLVDEKGAKRDGFLRLYDIYNLNLPAELVVLSACQTGLGKEIRGEGLVGLTRGFMYAGAERVMASLWKVDDSATSELMGRFYREMFANGRSPAAALRAAQAEMLNQKRWRAPYFWAAFVLQGEYK